MHRRFGIDGPQMCDTTGMKKIERGDEVKTRDERESCFGGFAPRGGDEERG